MNLLVHASSGRDDAAADTTSVDSLLARLALWQARCTCATTDILSCPNYLPGDERLFNGGDKRRVPA